MRIQNQSQATLFTPKRNERVEKNATGNPEPSGFGDYVEDVTVGAKLLALGLPYRAARDRLEKKFAENPPLKDSPPVKIEQPLVLIPGWKTTREAFDPLADKLLEGGRNGGKIYFIRDGEFFHDRDCSAKVAQRELDSAEPKLFEVVFTDVRVAPPVAARELKKNFHQIKQLTGEEKLDVQAYSMGGLATRKYLDEGGADIDQLLILGTPHRGSQFASWAKHVLQRDVKWAVSLAGLLPADIPALEWLAPEEYNEHLQQLNARWPQQKERVEEVKIMGGKGTVTADSGWWPVTSGDGLVAVHSVAPPGEKATIIPGQHHGHLNNDPTLYDAMREFFGWVAE